ncbi:MAG: type II toxin-antitoxin system HicB family antitoxin [Phycisphaeraceae bacterium]|nr:type II toxin-antitoxin system HicB family antitoxin [Phycisphaeraceae bacterium]
MASATHKYHINLFYSAEDKAYIADVPDLKFCSAHGPTPEKALREVLVAIDAWIATAKKHGKRVPKPKYRPMIYAAAS